MLNDRVVCRVGSDISVFFVFVHIISVWFSVSRSWSNKCSKPKRSYRSTCQLVLHIMLCSYQSCTYKPQTMCPTEYSSDYTNAYTAKLLASSHLKCDCDGRALKFRREKLFNTVIHIFQFQLQDNWIISFQFQLQSYKYHHGVGSNRANRTLDSFSVSEL